jgi:hypothetical protein
VLSLVLIPVLVALGKVVGPIVVLVDNVTTGVDVLVVGVGIGPRSTVELD